MKAAQAVFRAVGRAPSGLAVRIHSDIPLASGLGSSATAILGGMVAANALIGSPLDREALLKLAIELEGHPDNVTAAMLGGLVISSYDGEVLVYKSVGIEALQAVVVLPEVDLSTDDARKALPDQVSLKDAAQNVGRTALVVQALVEGDYTLLGDAMRDKLHEPHRMKLIPGFEAASQAARDNGAAAVALSGAGPALVAFAEAHHARIANAVSREFQQATGNPARTWVLSVDTQGIAISEMADEMYAAREEPEAVSAAPPVTERPAANDDHDPLPPDEPSRAWQDAIASRSVDRTTEPSPGGEVKAEPAQTDDSGT